MEKETSTVSKILFFQPEKYSIETLLLIGTPERYGQHSCLRVILLDVKLL